MERYKYKVVVVTGGATGIGKEIAKAYGAEAASVVIADTDIDSAIKTKDEILSCAGDCEFFRTDVRKEEDVISLMNFIGQKYGKIDVLINNAGVFDKINIQEMTLNHWQMVIDINLTGPFLCSKYALEHIKPSGGSIVNISSTRALMSEGDSEAYDASKAGLLGLTRSLAVSLSERCIRVNAVSPGWIETKGQELRIVDHLRHPAARVGIPSDVAGLCLFITSSEAGFITGANFVVDGGMTVKMIYES